MSRRPELVRHARRHWSLALVALSLCLLLLPAKAALAEGDAMSSAADFEGKSLDNEKFQLREMLKKGPVFLNFWATWCKPCMQELPEVEKIWIKYRARGFQFVTVTYDDQKTVAKVKPLVKSKQFTFPVILDPDHTISSKYNVRNCPTSYLIGQDGHIVYTSLGYKPGDEKALEEKIVKLLPAASVSPAKTEDAEGVR